jgi:hypothetical protein
VRLTSYYPRNRDLVKLVYLFMKTFLRGLATGLVLPLCCLSLNTPTVWGAARNPARKNAGENKTGDVLLSTMKRELQRATTDLKHLDPAPYFVSYSVYDQDGTVVVGGLGSLLNSTEFRRRTGEVTMRVGSARPSPPNRQNSRNTVSTSQWMTSPTHPQSSPQVRLRTSISLLSPGSQLWNKLLRSTRPILKCSL